MKKIVVTSCGCGIVFFLVGFLLLWWMVSPVDRSDIGIRQITVAKGATGTSIAATLEENGIVRSALMLRIMLRSKDAAAAIQAGTYELSPAMSVGDVADALLKGSKDNWVTLLEGWRSEEVADALATNFGLRYFDPSVFLQLAKGKEGTLFPDTYLFPKQTTAQIVIDTLTNTFEKKYQKLVAGLGTPKLTKEQTIVLASLVEREARDPQAMKIVAGILMNRLENDIPLQVDSTLQFVKGYDAGEKSWWTTPKASDKRLVSPFNTYMNKGLPPSPICNPGSNALRAAISPQKSDYLYYLSDTKGNMHYARTLVEHNANVEKYLR